MSDPYTSHSTGKLKLKGVKDSKISKHKKKKDKDKSGSASKTSDSTTTDNSVVLKHLAAEDAAIEREHATKDTTQSSTNPSISDAEKAGNEDQGAHKTEAERRWDEARGRRLEERLKREGVKSHKERVQELNRYLSGLSEHHDMPKIGPG